MSVWPTPQAGRCRTAREFEQMKSPCRRADRQLRHGLILHLSNNSRVLPRMLRSMKSAHWLTGFCFLCAVATAISHPNSGIVVNERGEVFFVHSGRGLAKLDQAGKLTYVRPCTGGHWLCLDPNGSFSRTDVPTIFDTSPNPLPTLPQTPHPACGHLLPIRCGEGKSRRRG